MQFFIYFKLFFYLSSGTEGDSSQQSVVYLHATTVGHIPQPYVLNSRRSSKSRDELSSMRTKSSNATPMTRTVSRSVSMLAPWTPKHIGDGYEINYSQTMQNNSVRERENKLNNSRFVIKINFVNYFRRKINQMDVKKVHEELVLEMIIHRYEIHL